MDALVVYPFSMDGEEAVLENSRDARADDMADIARFKGGDLAAFESLVTKYEGELFRLSRRMLGNPDDAMDATQEIFLRVFRGLRRFRGEASFRTWAYGIALNVCRSRLSSGEVLRNRKTDSLSGASGPDGDTPGTDLPDTASNPESSALAGEIQGALDAALLTVSEEYREILVLREIEGLEYRELSSILRCRAGTVKSRLSRARRALREALEGIWP